MKTNALTDLSDRVKRRIKIMAKTNFAALDEHKKKVWSRDTWFQAREKMFITKFVGKSSNSMIQRVTELTKTERGHEAVITLVPDITGDGVNGDNELLGNEEEMKSVQAKITIDQLRNAIRNTGRLSDQGSVVSFRKHAKGQLSNWLAERTDQLAFLTMAGLDYSNFNHGGSRPAESSFRDLTFGGDVAPPSNERYFVVQGDTLSDSADNTALTATDKLGYRHIVRMQALAKTRYVRGIRGKGGSETYHLFLHPMALAELKLDADFIANARHAGVRGASNTLWTGGESYVVDGVMIHEYKYVPVTMMAATGNKWGAAGDVDGCRALLCGAQALALIDLDSGYWDEEDFDYKNSYGVSYGKIFGMLKPKFKYAKMSADTEVSQDYGVICIDCAI